MYTLLFINSQVLALLLLHLWWEMNKKWDMKTCLQNPCVTPNRRLVLYLVLSKGHHGCRRLCQHASPDGMRNSNPGQSLRVQKYATQVNWRIYKRWKWECLAVSDLVHADVSSRIIKQKWGRKRVDTTVMFVLSLEKIVLIIWSSD